MKVAGYIRVSTQAQAQEGESLKAQEKQIRDFIKWKKGEGWKLFKIYSDEGISGFKAENRPGFQQMVEDGKRGLFQGIVFTRFSRFARMASDFLKYRDELKENDVLLFSIKENVDPFKHARHKFWLSIKDSSDVADLNSMDETIIC